VPIGSRVRRQQHRGAKLRHLWTTSKETLEGPQIRISDSPRP
jgi:hypothetical protein